MTEEEARVEINVLTSTIQTQNEIIGDLCRTIDGLRSELSKLPGGMEVIQKLDKVEFRDGSFGDEDDEDY